MSGRVRPIALACQCRRHVKTDPPDGRRVPCHVATPLLEEGHGGGATGAEAASAHRGRVLGSDPLRRGHGRGLQAGRDRQETGYRSRAERGGLPPDPATRTACDAGRVIWPSSTVGRRSRGPPLAGPAPELTAHCQAFRGVLGASVYICRPADLEAKGMLERFHDYLERSFLPGHPFDFPEGFNVQLSAFVAPANPRRMRVRGCRITGRRSGSTASVDVDLLAAPTKRAGLDPRPLTDPHYRGAFDDNSASCSRACCTSRIARSRSSWAHFLGAGHNNRPRVASGQSRDRGRFSP